MNDFSHLSSFIHKSGSIERYIDGKIKIKDQNYNNLKYLLTLINDNYNHQLNQYKNYNGLWTRYWY